MGPTEVTAPSSAPGARVLSFRALEPVSESLLLPYTGTVMASTFFSTSYRVVPHTTLCADPMRLDVYSSADDGPGVCIDVLAKSLSGSSCSATLKASNGNRGTWQQPTLAEGTPKDMCCHKIPSPGRRTSIQNQLLVPIKTPSPKKAHQRLVAQLLKQRRVIMPQHRPDGQVALLCLDCLCSGNSR